VHGVDALTALVAGLVASLRTALAADVCPGGWPWAVTALGVGVGLLPTAGAVLVAVLRRRIGSRYGAGESVLMALAGLVGAGLLPLAVFNATGNVFRAVATRGEAAGLTAAQVEDLGTTVCFTPQSAYLGGYTVSAAFDPADPVRFGLAVVLLLGFPLVAALCVAAQARLALRRGPSWPAKFFWMPLVAIALLTARTPAGSSGHLWIGVATGAFLGIAVVLVIGAPPREVVRRSLAAPAPAQRRPPRPDEPPLASPADIAARALAERGVLLLSGPLSDDKATEIAAQVLAIDPDSGPVPVTLHVMNVTGSIAAALMLHDLLRTASASIRTVGGGMLDTSGALVVCAGTAGQRELLASARIQIMRIDGPATPGLDLESAAREVAQLRAAVAAALGVDVERRRVLTAQEAVAAGVADRISLMRK
jgi:ATP-dependent protease ClpP protease subunit